ncbi:MAG: HAMP domain-containing histidine kinase [Defluviitaleaceae bacterium]|nr:HAMP domain-containing histidine kinase [Defluviitaleaceae bacterium]
MSETPELASCEQTLHDIKTPLSIMYNSIRELERAARQHSEFREPLETLRRNWLRILKLVTDAGDYRKLDLGLMLPKQANHDIVTLVRNITESTRALTDRRDIRLIFDTSIDEKRMAVDRDIIDRILLNLLSNAIKFTDNGGGITVRLAEDGDMLSLTVSDTGVGISAEHARRVFEPHYFVAGPRNTSGTGMGLYIVKQLVDLLSGEVRLEDSSAGAAITVRLPCFVIEEDQQEFRYFDDFYIDNMVQIELSDAHYNKQ